MARLENVNEGRAHYAVAVRGTQKETSTFTELQTVNQQRAGAKRALCDTEKL